MTTSIHGTTQGANSLSSPEDRYGKTADPVERRRLSTAVVAAYAPRVAAVARTLLRATSEHWPEAEQAGAVGVLEALQAYDPELSGPNRGGAFWGFARSRVIDEIQRWMDVGVFWRKRLRHGEEAEAAAKVVSVEYDDLQHASDNESPEDAAEKAELRAMLGGFTRRLSQSDRVVALADNRSRVSPRRYRSLVAQARAALGQKGGE